MPMESPPENQVFLYFFQSSQTFKIDEYQIKLPLCTPNPKEQIEEGDESNISTYRIFLNQAETYEEEKYEREVEESPKNS